MRWHDIYGNVAAPYMPAFCSHCNQNAIITIIVKLHTCSNTPVLLPSTKFNISIADMAYRIVVQPGTMDMHYRCSIQCINYVPACISLDAACPRPAHVLQWRAEQQQAVTLLAPMSSAINATNATNMRTLWE